jgi:AraC-like DNA-binding protein
MKISFKAEKPENWIINIAHQLSQSVYDGKIDIPQSYGKGFIKQISLNDELVVYFLEATFNIPLNIYRQKSDYTGIFPIMFWISDNDISQTLNNESRKLSLNSPYGIFFPSSHIATELILPAGEQISNITIVFTTKWFDTNISANRSTDHIRQLIKSKSSFFIYEDISLQIREIIQQIIANSTNGDYSLLYLKGKIFELLSIFFTKVNKRETAINERNINENDVQRLFEARKILLSDFTKMQEIKKVCKQIAMSESKFQKLFKQMFGISAYQYYISAKMIEAKKLLLSGKYSVSEIGYMLGYSNLSHFIDIFKKHFHISPAKFQQQQTR